MKELEELQQKAQELATGLKEVNDKIEALSNPTEFDKLPIGKLCLIKVISSQFEQRLAVRQEGIKGAVNLTNLNLNKIFADVQISKDAFNSNYAFFKVLDLD